MNNGRRERWQKIRRDQLDEADARCADCIQLGCECPQGYESLPWICSACSYRFALLRPGCIVDGPPACPDCAGSCEEDAGG